MYSNTKSQPIPEAKMMFLCPDCGTETHIPNPHVGYCSECSGTRLSDGQPCGRKFCIEQGDDGMVVVLQPKPCE